MDTSIINLVVDSVGIKINVRSKNVKRQVMVDNRGGELV
jgi:hypothetical protein